MKIIPKIIGTSFYKTVLVQDTDLLIVDLAENTLLSHGLLTKEKSKTKLKLKTRLGQHLAYQPFLFVNSIDLTFLEHSQTIDSNKIDIEYRVNHFIPVVAALVFSALSFDGYNSPLT
ncbi:MAG: hypothetical protein ACI865_003402, partial [Flavobacteriaceae bacterium]